uniref:Uncharacterized protein n=2 Tax=Canis lupus TaxID=9612 RepID=A0A8C0TC20_CANLF
MHHLQPAPGHWRLLPMEVPVCTGAWKWLRDSQDTKGSFTSLGGEGRGGGNPPAHNQLFPSNGYVLCRGPKRVVAASVTTVQCQTGLTECNTSCDDTGKLILQPRPHVQ